MGRIAGVERPENGALSAVWWLRMIDGVDQHREAKDIGEEDELLRGTVSPASHNLAKATKDIKMAHEDRIRLTECDNAEPMNLPGTW